MRAKMTDFRRDDDSTDIWQVELFKCQDETQVEQQRVVYIIHL